KLKELFLRRLAFQRNLGVNSPAKSERERPKEANPHNARRRRMCPDGQSVDDKDARSGWPRCSVQPEAILKSWRHAQKHFPGNEQQRAKNPAVNLRLPGASSGRSS